MKYPGTTLIVFLTALYGSFTIVSMLVSPHAVTMATGSVVAAEDKCGSPTVKSALSKVIDIAQIAGEREAKAYAVALRKQSVVQMKGWGFSDQQIESKLKQTDQENQSRDPSLETAIPVIVATEHVASKLDVDYCESLVTIKGKYERRLTYYSVYTEEGLPIVKLRGPVLPWRN